MKLHPMDYWIDDRFIGKAKVSGFAINSGLPVRICIHLNKAGYWVADHFDSGFRYGDSMDAATNTLEEAAYYATSRMEAALWSGQFVTTCLQNGFSIDQVESFTRP